MVRIYYSGSTSGESLPERVLANHKIGVMLTYWEIHDKKGGDTVRRFERHAKRRLAKLEKKRKKRHAH